jgi:hypothetical protein
MLDDGKQIARAAIEYQADAVAILQHFGRTATLALRYRENMPLAARLSCLHQNLPSHATPAFDRLWRTSMIAVLKLASRAT